MSETELHEAIEREEDRIGARMDAVKQQRDKIDVLQAQLAEREGEIERLREALVTTRAALVEYADDDESDAYLHAGGIRAAPHDSIRSTLATVDAALAPHAAPGDVEGV